MDETGLKRIRGQLGLTEEGMAKRLTVSSSTYRHAEKGKPCRYATAMEILGVINGIRAEKGTIKTLTVKREGEHWYAIFICEMARPEPLPVSHEDVGIDLGVTHFAALSNGEFIDHPRCFRKAEKKVAAAQQSLSRKKKGSHRRKKTVKQVASCHRTIANQRKDFQHKASRKLVNQYQVIVCEDLQTKNLTKAPAPKQDETGKYVPNGAAAKAG
jgi:putative transposase